MKRFSIKFNPNLVKVRKVFGINQQSKIIPSNKIYNRQKVKKELRDELRNVK